MRFSAFLLLAYFAASLPTTSIAQSSPAKRKCKKRVGVSVLNDTYLPPNIPIDDHTQSISSTDENTAVDSNEVDSKAEEVVNSDVNSPLDQFEIPAPIPQPEEDFEDIDDISESELFESEAENKILPDSDLLKPEFEDTEKFVESVPEFDDPLVDYDYVEPEFEFPKGFGAGKADNGALLAHNLERERHGMPDIKWNINLATEALIYAKYLGEICTLTHSNASGRGENLAYAATTDPGYPRVTMGDMTQQFIRGSHEILHYDRVELNHHTQLVWKTTTDVGCAKANSICVKEEGNNEISWYSTFMVCRYTPPGNWEEQFWADPLN